MLPSGTVTFLFTDIEGSTQRWARDRAAMQEALQVHDRLLRDAIAQGGGYVFKTMGDAFCAAFTTPESAAAAALAAQRALEATDFSAVDGLRVRMAIATGTADERDGDYSGPVMNRVARLLPLGHGGQVLLSEVAAGLVRENPPAQATLADLGEHALRELDVRERVYQLVTPDLRRDFPDLRSWKARQPWFVPEPMRTRYFTGRDDLLARLRRQLLEQRRAALSGLGGVGKTQTAIEYAVRHRAEYTSGVFWINAETTGGLTGGFVEIAKALRLAAADSTDQEAAVKAALAWLNHTDDWLLILDNVDERREVRPFVPEPEKGHVLITSRESVFPDLGIPRVLTVSDLDGPEAVRFLLTRTGLEAADSRDQDTAAELAAQLGNLPLALEQAAAYIAETGVSFSGYLSALRKRRLALLEKAGELVSRETVAVTWAANFEAVQRASPAAAEVLRISAFLSPDTIPFELFLKGARALGSSIAEALDDPDELTMIEVLRPLARYSLIRTDESSRAFSVHRLVQEIVRTSVSVGECGSYVERVIGALDAVLPSEGAFAEWARSERFIPHVVSIAPWLATYPANPETVGRVLNRTGRHLYEQGRFEEARALLEHALALAEREYGADHLEIARSAHHLAIVYWYQAKFADARPLHERALRIRERVLGPEHVEVANSLNALGVVLVQQDRRAEARTLFERALTIRERAYGPEDASVAPTLINLANIEDEAGRSAEGLAQHERALAIWVSALGPDHPNVAGELDNVGSIHASQGRYDEAQVLHERAIAIRERVLGPEHPDVAFGLKGLAELATLRGRYEQAEQLFVRARDIRERAYGADHPLLAEVLTGLANALAAQDRYAEAETAFERALFLRERAKGQEHTYVAEVLRGFATLRRKQGRDGEAAAIDKRVLAIERQSQRPKEDRVWVEPVFETPVAAARVRLAPQDVARSFRTSLDKVWAFLGKEPGLRTDGHNIFIYHRNHDVNGDGKIEIDFGVQVVRDFAGAGDVISTTSPAGRAAVSKHVGAYDRIGETHAAVRRWCVANGHALAGVDWEVYGDWNDDPTKLETHVHYLLK